MQAAGEPWAALTVLTFGELFKLCEQVAPAEVSCGLKLSLGSKSLGPSSWKLTERSRCWEAALQLLEQAEGIVGGWRAVVICCAVLCAAVLCRVVCRWEAGPTAGVVGSSPL